MGGLPFSPLILGPQFASRFSSGCTLGVPQVYEWLLLTGLLRPDVRTFNLILEAYGQSGQPHKCAALFQAMQEGTAVVQETVQGWGAQARAVTSHSAPVTSHSVPVTIHSGPVASGGTTVTAQPEPLFQEEDSGESAEGPGAGQGHTGEEGRAAVEEEGHEERVEETGAASEAPLAVGGTPPVQGAQAGSEEGAEAQVSGGRVLAEGACIPSEASWNVLIAAYCQAGLLKEADAAFQDMKARGYTPSEYTPGVPPMSTTPGYPQRTPSEDGMSVERRPADGRKDLSLRSALFLIRSCGAHNTMLRWCPAQAL